MGANLCCIWRSSVGGPAAVAASGDGLAGYEICRWRRLQWRRRREKLEVKREIDASIEKREYMSLEELMLASPRAVPSELGFGSGGGEFNVSSRSGGGEFNFSSRGGGGEFNFSSRGGFKRKVHPARHTNGSDQDEYSVGGFLICRSESGKMKKKVSFRLPEVSDVIVIYSPAADPSADVVNVGT